MEGKERRNQRKGRKKEKRKTEVDVRVACDKKWNNLRQNCMYALHWIPTVLEQWTVVASLGMPSALGGDH